MHPNDISTQPDAIRKLLQDARTIAIVGLSASRLRAWRNAEQGCLLDDQSSCPKSSPTRLTAGEVSAVREMVTSV